MTDEERLMAQFQQMSTPRLCKAAEGWREGTRERMMADFELQRRRDRGAVFRGWVSIGVSILSLTVAIVALCLRTHR